MSSQGRIHVIQKKKGVEWEKENEPLFLCFKKSLFTAAEIQGHWLRWVEEVKCTAGSLHRGLRGSQVASCRRQHGPGPEIVQRYSHTYVTWVHYLRNLCASAVGAFIFPILSSLQLLQPQLTCVAFTLVSLCLPYLSCSTVSADNWEFTVQ